MNTQPFVSIVVPAYNEEKRITPTLKAISSFMEHSDYSYEILVVDDGSKDKTKQVVERLELPHTRVLSYGQNRGKGYAINFGMRSASGAWILFTDADNSTPISELPKLLAVTGGFPVVIGSRYLSQSDVAIKQPFVRIVLSRIGNLLTQLLVLPGIKDTQCGFKLFSQEAVSHIFPKQTIWGWGFDIEILRIAKECGYKIKEIPVTWMNDEHSRLQSSRAFIGTFTELLRIKKNSLSGKYSSAISRSEPQLIVRFAVVGAIGTALDFAVLNLTHGVLGFPLLLGLTLGFAVGAINNYILNSIWSFGQKTTWKKFGIFFVIACGGLVINDFVASFAVNTFSWNYNAAKLLAVGIVFIWTYVLNRKLTFK